MRTRNHRFFAVLAWTAANGFATSAAWAQEAKTPASPQALLGKFLRIRTPGAPTITADGTMYVRDWPDGIYQLYRVEVRSAQPAATPGGPMTKLTTFSDGMAGYTVSPDGKRILALAAVGGNENTQVYSVEPGPDAASTKVTSILSGPRVQFAVNHWLADSSGFLYTANDASPNDFHVYRYDFAKPGESTGKSTKLLGNEGSWSAGDITADGTRVLVTHEFSASNAVLHELNTANGKLTDISILPDTGENKTAGESIVGYMPGEGTVLIISDKDAGVKRLYLRNLVNGQVVTPIPALNNAEIDEATINEDRNLLAVVANVDGYGELSVYHLPGFEKLPLPQIEKGVVGGVHFRHTQLTWSLSNARVPGLAFLCTMPLAAGSSAPAARQITFAETQGIDLSGFPLPELVKYKSFDGLEIPAFLYLPAGYKKGTPIPFIVNYHGGPEGQHRPSFTALTQFLLTQGYGMILPNVRGSEGYGRAYQMMDDYKKRWDSVKDGVMAAQWLVDNAYSAPGKIATYGGSYGGFMSVACVVEDQERVDRAEAKQRLFGAGVDVVGIVNLKTFLEKTSGYRRKLREAEYGPLTDPDFLLSVSSIKRADKINIPMFIAHGFNDPRVPVEEAMQLATALKDRKLDPQLFIAPDEGHGFQKLDNREYFYQRMISFLKQAIGN